MSLEGGRKLTWERNFSSESEVKPDRGFWNKVVDVIAGSPDFRPLVQPYSIVVDSRGRVIITDPAVSGVHIFDFKGRKYKLIQRIGKTRDSMLKPQCVAVDAHDNIYVTDSDSGAVFVFEPGGKYLRTIGRLRGGEGYFERPTGIASTSPIRCATRSSFWTCLAKSSPPSASAATAMANSTSPPSSASTERTSSSSMP
jgi:hypothetical protein